MNTHILQQAVSLLSKEPLFHELSENFRRLSPLEALGVSNYEIRHGNFLEHLLNPNAAHGHGHGFVNDFLRAALTAPDDQDFLAEMLIQGLSQVYVRREWHNIDILLEASTQNYSFVMAIELKTRAKESKHQLEKYYSFLENSEQYANHNRRYIFLTPLGEESTHTSYLDMSIINDLGPTFDAMRESAAGDSMANKLIGDYIDTLRRMFVEDDRLHEIARQLWNKYPDLLSFLADNKPNIVGQVFDILITKSPGDLLGSSTGEHTLQSNWSDKTSARLLLTFPEFDLYAPMLDSTDHRLKGTKRLLTLEIAKSADKIWAAFVIGPGETHSRRDLLQKLIDGNAETGKQKTTDKMAANYSSLGGRTLFKLDTSQVKIDLDSAAQKAERELQKLVKSQHAQFCRILLNSEGNRN